MKVVIAQILVYTVLAYLAVGFLFAFYFVFAKLRKFDPAAKEAGNGFRLIIFFGSIPFWPLLAYRMKKGNEGLVESNAHRNAVEAES